MASNADSSVTSSPGVLTKLLKPVKRGLNPYKEITLTSTPSLPSPFRPPSVNHPLLDVIRDEDLESDKEKWIEWLENEQIACEEKLKVLCGRDGKGWTALHHAARHSCTEILSCAADVEGVDMNIATRKDCLTPLLVAAKYSVKNSVVWMLGSKDTANIHTSAVTATGQNALHLVVQNQQCEYSLEPLLRQLDRKLWYDADKDGNIPLHIACAHGNVAALQQGFFKREIWVMEDDSEGGSGAASDEGSEGEGSEGSDDGSRAKRGRDEEGEERGPMSSLWVADKVKSMILTTNSDRQTPLHLAAQNGHDKVVSVLINHCRDVIKYHDSNGDMALHLACRRGHLDVVKEILEWEPTTVGNKYTNGKGETPVHCAAYNSDDNGSLMEYLMEVCEKNGTLDTHEILSLHEKEARHTPLMLACTKGKPEVVKVLMNYGADVTQREKEMEEGAWQEEEEQETLNSLELAIENGRREVAKVIIDRPDWRKSLRTSNVIERVVNTPFRRMIRKMPDIALVVLDKCTVEKKDRDDVNFEMSFDYEFVEDFCSDSRETTPTSATNRVSSGSVGRGRGEEGVPGVRGGGVTEGVELREVKVMEGKAAEDEGEEEEKVAGVDDTDGSSESQEKDEWRPREYDKQNHVLYIMVENDRSKLLRHPLVTSLLNHKWSQFGAWLYFSNLLFYLIYVFFLTAFALAVPNPQEETCEDLGSEKNSTRDTSCGITTGRRNFLYLAAVVTVLLALARLLVEVFQLVNWNLNCSCTKRCKIYINVSYFLDWTNYLEITLYVFSIAFVMVLGNTCFCPTSFQWQIGTVAIFFAWIGLLLFLYKLPGIGIYVGMMLQITRRFLNVVIMAILLALAFGFAFYMAFYEPSIPASPFRNPALAFIKLMVMTSGGPDDTIFRYENEGSGTRDELPFPAVAFFIWVIFIVIMSILFVNFLVGLAVDDVKQIQRDATLRRLSLKVDLVLSTEQVFPILRHGNISHKVYPNKRLRWYKKLWKNFYSLVWDDDLTDSIQSSLNPEEDTDFKVDSLSSAVEQLVAKNLSQEKMLMDILQEMRNRNRQAPT